MKSANHHGRSSARATDLYRDFMSLDPPHRRGVALRILRNQRLLADLYDHFLIERALNEGGQSIAWRNGRRSSRRAKRGV